MSRGGHHAVARCAGRIGVVLTVLVTSAAAAAIAAAQPLSDSSVARIDHIVARTDRWLEVFVDSPSMNRVVQVDVLLPADPRTPRPTVYMLQGGDGVEPDQSDWTYQGGAVQFFADKDVNVVLPVGAPGSYYTDWRSTDPVLGRQKWETFLTREIPPLFDARFHGNGANTILGASMGAQAAMILAERTGHLYRAVAAYSGCYFTSDPFGQAEIRFIVHSKGATPDNMWGPGNDPDWVAHDVMINAAALAGKTVYVSSGPGVPGPHETPDNPDLLDAVFGGGPIESVTHYCTVRLQNRLRALAVPATFDYTPTGTHSWPYWTDQLAASWPYLAHALSHP
ncbi:alpha/beta hydrolase [Nocardia sp. NPDC051570]|uniref:alpha/beta hydrolase n=1 Tax=Nocardia sp. NPDC051570 TaxID=3364324 RepID=UPI00379EE68E